MIFEPAIDISTYSAEINLMWLSGRRAVRPDRDYYRNVRRIRLRTNRGKPTLMFEVVAVAVFVVIVLAGWRIFH